VIDAVNFNEGMYKSVKDSQYQETIVNKELHKAYMGFSDGEFLDESLGRRQVATGKWGCGAFGGDPELKLIIQWLACSWAERDMIYVNWGEEDQSSNTVSLHEII
jgi:poly(ADP-ribose) glycohydrolase